MNFPQIRMESTQAKLAITTEQGAQSIEQPKADLSIVQPKADLQIKTTPGKLTIDQTKAREDMDLKSISRRIEEYAQNGYKDWLSGMARMSQDGDELMMIESGGNPIPEQAKRNSESPIFDFNIAFIPSNFSVKINYQPADVKIDWKTHKPVIEVQVNKPRISYTPGIVRGEMKQWASLKIEVMGLGQDKKVKD